MAVTDHSPEAVEQRAADLQRSREASSSMDNAELFRSAMADTTVAAAKEQPSQQPEPTSEQPRPPRPTRRPRDEQGRFLPKSSEPTDQAPQAPAAATQQQPGQPAAPPEAKQ